VLWPAFSCSIPSFPERCATASSKSATPCAQSSAAQCPAPTIWSACEGSPLAKWSYVRIDDLISWGLHEAIDHLQSDLNRLHENRLHELIHKRYFVTSQPGSSTTDPACVLK